MSLVLSNTCGTANIFIDSSRINRGIRICAGGTGEFPSDAEQKFNAKQKRRRICLENLSKKWAPSETTRRHRKEVRVTDLQRPSVYILFRDDEVVYVGQSQNPYARMAQHLKDKRFTHIRIMSCSKSRARYWEEKLIKAYRPEYNKVHNTVNQ